MGNRTLLVQGTRVKKLRKLAREQQQTTENGIIVLEQNHSKTWASDLVARVAQYQLCL